MELKHTPGEWYIQFMDEGKPEPDFWVKSDHNDVVHYGTDIMADDFGEHNGYPYEQRLADAKLIAAAPEMLEALQNIENDDNSIPKPIWDMVKSAIKKAIN